MTEEIERVETTEIEIEREEQLKADLTKALIDEIIARKNEIALNITRIGQVLSRIQEEKLFKYCGADTFEEFCGFPEISLSTSTAQLYMKIFRMYIRQLGYDPEYIATIEVGKLNIINSRVSKYPEEAEEWLHKAQHLSQSDLINEVREIDGKPPMLMQARDVKNKEELFKFDDYVEFVKNHGCILRDCNDKSGVSDPHHFPRTKGAGAPDHHVIPLCRRHHTQWQNYPIDFLNTYRDDIFEYFYDTFAKAFAFFNNFVKEIKDE